MVGRAMAEDLARDFAVTVVDRDPQALGLLKAPDAAAAPIQTHTADLSDPAAVSRAVQGFDDAPFDLVVGAVPGFMGFQTLKTALEAGVDVVDISFFPEDPFELDALARENGRTAVVDIGVAPGMDNILLGYHNERMQVDRFVCMVGGLPAERRWPFAYKAPFSPIDVLEEYTRPARYRVNGGEVVRPALSDVELVDLPGMGTLEAFNSDGLRSLLRTIDAPNMVEKTLRYPGHADLMRVFRESGFFSEDPLTVRNSDGQDTALRPIDLTSSLLFQQWKLGADEEELTVMRVAVSGEDEGGLVRHTYDLLDRGAVDASGRRISSMSRTTGYTATGAARLVIDGRYHHPGISPPEYLGKKQEHFEFLMAHLAQREVVYRHREDRSASKRSSTS